LLQNPVIGRCIDRLQRFGSAWLAQHDEHSYGFAVPTADYLAAQTADNMPPGMMVPPRALLDAWPSRRAIEATARDQGWPYLEHVSCLGGQRLFLNVTDPDRRFEQWLLFGFEPATDQLPPEAIVSFLAVQQRELDGTPLDKVRVHFRDYLLSAGGDTASELQLPEGSGGKCFACHVSGVRQLAPFAGGVLFSEPVLGEPGYGSPIDGAFGRQRLDEFQQRLASYGLPDWGEHLAQEDHGPWLGAELACTDCHDNQTRGALSVFTSEGTLYQKVLEQLSMRAHRAGQLVPDQAAMALVEREKTGAELSSDELRQLSESRAEHRADYDALVASRLPALERWLLERPCD
jgi:hypothetical protein